MTKKIILLFCIVVLSVPLAAQDFFVKEWEKTYSTEELKEAIQCMDVGDLNGDGIPEIVAGTSVRALAGTQKYAVDILDHQGTRKYRWDSTYPINDVSISDIDNDGEPEILVSGADLYVLSNRALNLDYPPVGTVVFSAVAVDLDNDEKKELLVGTREVICISDTIPWTAPIGSQVKKIMIRDLNWDGTDEIVVLTIQNVHVFNTTGTKLWISQGTQNLRDVAVADIDEDRTAEILYSTDNRRIFIWEAREDGMEKEIHLGSYSADLVAVGDLNKDGTVEVIVASDTLRLEILDLEGNPLWQYKFQRIETRDAFADIIVSDIDGDQWLDILLAQKVTSMSTDVDSFLYFMKNQSGIAPPPDRSTELYNSAVVLFQSGNCSEAVTVFAQAQTLFLENQNQKMADTCQEYIDQCERILEEEKAAVTFSEAETYFEQEAYAEALELYKEAKTLYENLGDSEKAQLCSQRIAEIEELQSPPVEPQESPEEEDSQHGMMLIIIVAAVLAVAGTFIAVNHFKGAQAKPAAEKRKEKIKEETKRELDKEEKEEETQKEETFKSEKIKEKERKLKAQFVYGEIDRERYREELRKLYEEED